MSAEDTPQLYLVSPLEFDLETFSARLAEILDTVDIACFRLAMATRDEGKLGKAADALREICHARDVAIVIEDHISLAETHGLDGVHFSDASKSVRKARATLGEDAIIGVNGRASSHSGMSAGEAGADYVCFGPVVASALEDEIAEFDLFEWWSQMIEIPVVAEGGLSADMITKLSPVTDFFAIGDEIWRAENPVEALKDLKALLS